MLSRSAAVVGLATPSSSAITGSDDEIDGRSGAKNQSHSLLKRFEFVIIPPPIAHGSLNVQVVSDRLRRGPGLEAPKVLDADRVLRRDGE